MELPKNITQIGEVGKDCKVYVEDYVVSYLKQLNGSASEKQTAAALYGKRRTEGGVTYYFLYGACRLDMLRKEARHLSQAQLQEAERLRVCYFPEQEFLGYRILNGETIEGFHIREQEICRYIAGYAQFYEKNDAMLAYMLNIRDEVQPEQFDQSKYAEVRRRQEERRAASESGSRGGHRQRSGSRRVRGASNARYLKTAIAGAFVLLCLWGLVSLQDDAQPDELMQTAGEALSKITSGEILTMESKLEEALLAENRADAEETAAETVAATEEPVEETVSATEETVEETVSATEETVEETVSATEETVEETVSAIEETTEETAVAIEETTEETAAPTEETVEETAAPTEEAAAESPAITYVIRRGDTLSAISLRQYGSEKRVTELCEYNGISDPDDIKVGQIIMLPQ